MRNIHNGIVILSGDAGSDLSFFSCLCLNPLAFVCFSFSIALGLINHVNSVLLTIRDALIDNKEILKDAAEVRRRYER